MLPSRPAAPPSVSDLFLRTASGVFAELLTFNDLVQTIMDKVIEVTGATKGFLILVRGDGTLQFQVARNMKREEIENPRNRISRKLIDRVVATGQPVRTGHADQDPRFQDMESVHNLLLKSILCVPLKGAGKVAGVIYLENHLTAGVFDEKNQEMVVRVAEQASYALQITNVLESIRDERDRLQEENRGLRQFFLADQADQDFGRFIGRSPAMIKLASQLSVIGESRLTVLITGESGTGKELVTRLLHATGPLRDRPFVAVNCAAVPSALFESELFGHVKGAFTGADRNRAGKAEAAEGGTLFLDEVGDLPQEVQPKLLRLLEERTYERVGDNRTHRADIRVVAATHRDLADLVEKGQFREDLYYRLNQLPIALPPLRERPEDIEELALYFLRKEGCAARFTPAAVEFLRTYPWPGNVRSLRNVVQRAALYAAEGAAIDVDVLRAQLDEREGRLLARGAGFSVAVPLDVPYREALRRIEASYLRELMRRNPSLSRGELAGKMGMSRRTLFQRLRDLGITNGDGE